MNKHFVWSRKTIDDVIYSEGIGIHSGNSIRMRFLPANVDTGIIFINKKYGVKSPIRAIAESVTDTNFAVTLSNGEWQIKTVEHLLSVFYMFGINLLGIIHSSLLPLKINTHFIKFSCQ